MTVSSENIIANTKQDLRRLGALRRREHDVVVYTEMLEGKREFTKECPDKEKAQSKLDKANVDVENLIAKLT